MINKILLALPMSFLVFGCASIQSIDEIKSAQQKALNNAQEGAKDADAKFVNRAFSKDYKGDKAIKKIAIVYTQVSWDIGKDLRADGEDTKHVINPVAHKEKAQEIVNAVYDQAKSSFEKIGYTVLSPKELAEASPTYKAIAASSGSFTFSPTYGQEFTGLAVEESRWIDKMTHQGKLISKISEEAGIDAVVGLYVNDLGYSGQETNLNKTFISGVTSEVRSYLLMCVGKEQAKAAGVSTGWLGDANHCGEASAEFKNQYYLPWSNKSGEPEYESVLAAGYDHLKAVYPPLVRGMIEELKSEGL